MYMYISELSNKNDHCAVVIYNRNLVDDGNEIGYTNAYIYVSIQYTLVNYCITSIIKIQRPVHVL